MRDWGGIEAIAIATPGDIGGAAETIAGLIGEDDPAVEKLMALSG